VTELHHTLYTTPSAHHPPFYGRYTLPTRTGSQLPWPAKTHTTVPQPPPSPGGSVLTGRLHFCAYVALVDRCVTALAALNIYAVAAGITRQFVVGTVPPLPPLLPRLTHRACLPPRAHCAARTHCGMLPRARRRLLPANATLRARFIYHALRMPVMPSAISQFSIAVSPLQMRFYAAIAPARSDAATLLRARNALRTGTYCYQH